MRGGALLVALLVMAAAASAAAAQVPAEVRGRVMDAATGAGIAAARVEVHGTGQATASGPDGGFVLRGVLPGIRSIRVTALGYREERREVEVRNGYSAWLPIALEALPIAVEGVTASAPRAPDSPGGVVIGRAAIEASGARELGELLQAQPGVTVTRSGGPGAPSRISIRGSSADQVLVLVDGIPLNSLLTGEADLSAIPLEVVERITLLRGAQSARYGGRALGGVVLVETRRPAVPELTGHLAAGTWAERGAAASAAHQTRLGATSVGGLLGGEWRATRGDFGFEVPAARGGGTDRRANADADTRSLLGSLRMERERLGVQARGEVLRLERGMPGSVVQPSLTGRQEQQRISGGVTAQAETGRVAWSVSADAQRQAARFRDLAPPFGAAFDDSLTVTGLGGSASATVRLGAAELLAGTETRRHRFASTMLGEGAPDEQWLSGGWATIRASLASGAWILEPFAGLRLDHSTLLADPVVSPRLGASAGAGRLALRASAGGAFSPPSLADQFFQEGVQVRPNPELRPERVRRDIEAAASLRALQLGPVTADLEAGVFTADIEGMILWFPDFRFIWQPDNFDVRRRGWEAAGRIVVPVADAELRATVSRAAVEYAGTSFDGQVVYRPRLTANASAAATARGTRVQLSSRLVGERRTTPGSPVNRLEAFWLADARLSRDVRLGAWQAELGAAVENLLDQNAAMLIDYPFPGRTWSASVRIRHGQPRHAAGS